jgi:hypothetical protein
MSQIKSAINCFEENTQLFSDPKIEPEKYNLYAGLCGLARAMESIEKKVIAIEQAIGRKGE